MLIRGQLLLYMSANVNKRTAITAAVTVLQPVVFIKVTLR